MRPDVPIFDLLDYFETDLILGDKKLPVRVKRFSKAELAEFRKGWDAAEEPRGTAEQTPEQKAAREQQTLDFYERTIREAITLEPGLVRDRGIDVVDGEGFLGVFHARIDVLSATMVAIFMQNQLSDLIRKNSNSPRASESGSGESIPARGGDRPGSTADSADGSTTAAAGAATDASSQDAPARASSGVPDDPTRVH